MNCLVTGTKIGTQAWQREQACECNNCRESRSSVAVVQRQYDSTVARIAGNVAAGFVGRGTYDGDSSGLASASVGIARAIVAAMKTT